MQNRETFSFVDDLIDGKKTHYSRARVCNNWNKYHLLQSDYGYNNIMKVLEQAMRRSCFQLPAYGNI